ncbi:hypothetical protein HOY80DRAFT_1133645 [Tuber brumale]|nr:hypothetical protein HOY80DRAFT_1133645 [Tuber brumale]
MYFSPPSIPTATPSLSSHRYIQLFSLSNISLSIPAFAAPLSITTTSPKLRPYSLLSNTSFGKSKSLIHTDVIEFGQKPE